MILFDRSVTLQNRCEKQMRQSMLSRPVSWTGGSVAAFVLLLSLVTAVGCADLTGAGSSQSQGDKPARDIDEQVDAAVKDFKNE